MFFFLKGVQITGRIPQTRTHFPTIPSFEKDQHLHELSKGCPVSSKKFFQFSKRYTSCIKCWIDWPPSIREVKVNSTFKASVLRIWSQHHRGVGWILLQKRKILGQMWNQRGRKDAITKGPMSVQHSSAMFITKNRPTTRMISINSWLWQPRMAHVMTNLGGTGMQIRCWFKPNPWVSCLTGSQVDVLVNFLSHSLVFSAEVFYGRKCSKSHPLGLIPARTLRSPDHTRWTKEPSDAHQWFMYKGAAT